jgi:hypothetical protein
MINDLKFLLCDFEAGVGPPLGLGPHWVDDYSFILVLGYSVSCPQTTSRLLKTRSQIRVRNFEIQSNHENGNASLTTVLYTIEPKLF